MISIGANDRAIMQWKLHEDAVLDDADVVDEPESDDYAMELRDGSDLGVERHDQLCISIAKI